ncbi:MAG: hypothetical protein M3Y71_17035 [Actinomycetota bacterium]|nr:hypothetical protein [Actinomycetota bacterium]
MSGEQVRDEAERNREAAASVGIVRKTGQNKGQTIRVLGPRRVVLMSSATAATWRSVHRDRADGDLG